MVGITYLGPGQAVPEERHVTVVIHRERTGGERGYFFDSVKGDHGGSGPLDWLMNEAIKRAEKYASDNGIRHVVVRGQIGR